jgi:hypothetical protein
MATGSDVLTMLIPNGGWVISGNDYEGIQFLECQPITESVFKAGFAKFDAWQAEQDSKTEAAKNSAEAKLEAIGLTIADLKALGL